MTVVTRLSSLPVLVPCLLLVPGEPRTADLAWGAAAGVAGLAGVGLLYLALSGGAMAVAAPITAVTSAVVPMVVGLFVQRTPGTLALVGACCAVVAIALVSLGPGSGNGW